MINEAFAKRFFKDQNPIGQHFGPDKIKYSATYEIVGVVRDMRYMTYDYKDPDPPDVLGAGGADGEVRRSGLPRAAKSGRTICTTS